LFNFSSQITEQKPAKLPKKNQPNYRTEHSQIAEQNFKKLKILFEYQIIIVIL
jgi:hypothetical protein